MSSSSSTAASGQASVRSPLTYALYGAIVCFAVMGTSIYALWPGGGAPADAGSGGPPGGGFGFGPAPVEVVVAVETLAAEPVQLLGSTTPVRQAVVASEVEGIVAVVLVDEGDQVRERQVLVRLRTTTMQLDLAAARANRAEAAALLSRLESEVARLTGLRESGAISEREFELGVADRDAQAQAVVRFESQSARLEELIAQAEIVAPFTGQIAAMHAEVGEWTARGGDVVTMVDLSTVEVTVMAPERYVAQAEAARVAGVELEVAFDALPGTTYPGRIRAVLPQANVQARAFPVVITVDNSAGELRGGMFARIRAQVGAPTPLVLIPKDALVLRSGRTFVYRVIAEAGGDGGSIAQELEVRIGAGFGAWQSVDGGIAAGDLVVVRGNESLRQGAAVMVVGEFPIEPPPTADSDTPTVVEDIGTSR